MSKQNEIQLVYDKQCPVCDLFCRQVEVRDTDGRLVRIDAREHSDILDEITALGLDIDEGMVLKADGRLYYGSDAIHELARRSSRKGAFNALTHKAFGSRRVAKTLYPVMKALRNLLLKMLRRSRINNLGTPGRTRF